MTIQQLIELLKRLPPDDGLIFATPDEIEGHTEGGEGDSFWVAMENIKPINFGKLQDDGKRHEWIVCCTWHKLHRPIRQES